MHLVYIMELSLMEYGLPLKTKNGFNVNALKICTILGRQNTSYEGNCMSSHFISTHAKLM